WGQPYPTGTHRRLLALPEGDQVSRAPAPTWCQQGRQGLQRSANVPNELLGWVKQPVLVRQAVDVQYTLVIWPTPRLEQLDNIEAKRENQATLGDQLMTGLRAHHGAATPGMIVSDRAFRGDGTDDWGL